jgi:hypothetical protein
MTCGARHKDIGNIWHKDSKGPEKGGRFVVI